MVDRFRRALWTPSRNYSQKVLSIAPANLIAYWRMNEAVGSAAYDLARYVSSLLGNGGFETAGAGGADVHGSWTETAGDGAIANETTLIRTGSDALKLTAGATANTKEAQTLTVLAGESYSLDLYAAGDGSNAGRYLVYDVTNSANIIAATSTGVTAGAYGYVHTDFVTPAGCTSVRLDLMCPSANGGIAYFDDVELKGRLSSNGAYTGVDLNQAGIGDGWNAPYFDGTNDFNDVYTAALASNFNGAEGTALCWGKVNSSAIWTDGLAHFLLNIGVDANNQVRLWKFNGDNALYFTKASGGTNKQVGLAVTPTDFFVMALTWSAAADQQIAYYAGAQTGATQTGLGVWAGSLATTTVLIGAQTTVPATPWNGWLAHCAVWNTPLSASQIVNLASL